MPDATLSRNASSTPFPIDQPIDVFRRKLAAGIALGSGLLFLILIAGSLFIMWTAIAKSGEGNMEGVTSAAQSVPTASIGFIGGAAITTIGYFFQASE